MTNYWAKFMCKSYRKLTKYMFFALFTATFCISPVSAQTSKSRDRSKEKSKVERALSYKPVQRLVDYDIPSKEDIKTCKIEDSLTKYLKSGFAVYDKSGRLLRLFFDVNRDNSLDSYSYYKNGVEVYRDIDSDFDGHVDQFRWLGSAGIRHGVDLDKNRSIDRWEKLSASELAEEVFHSIRTADTARFKKVLISPAELKSLSLGEEFNKTAVTAVRAAASKFPSFAKSQKSINSRSKWTQFGGSRPSVVAKDGINSKKDLFIYEHAAAFFDTGGKFGQFSLGTIVQVSPNNWRVLQLPESMIEGTVVQNGGMFYPSIDETSSGIPDSDDSPQTRALVKLHERYTELDKQLKAAKGDAKIAKAEQDVAEMCMSIAKASSEKTDKSLWIQQMADIVASAYQADRFPGGLKFLEKQAANLKPIGMESELDYLKWRSIYAKFSVGNRRGDRRQRNKANERYLKDMEQFTKDYPKSEFAADALFQLGLTAEVSELDDPDKAIDFYTRCKRSFPNTVFGKKASGAIVRLSSQGKSLPFKGTTLNGGRFDLQSSQFRGKAVVIHYWETQCEACVDGFKELQRLGAKYKSDLVIVGANIDEDKNKAKQFLAKNRSVNWPQLYAPGGPEKSSLAMQLGVSTLPLTMLVDQRGKLVESSIPVDDLDREIQRLIRRGAGQANLRKPTR